MAPVNDMDPSMIFFDQDQDQEVELTSGEDLYSGRIKRRRIRLSPFANEDGGGGGRGGGRRCGQ